MPTLTQSLGIGGFLCTGFLLAWHPPAAPEDSGRDTSELQTQRQDSGEKPEIEKKAWPIEVPDRRGPPRALEQYVGLEAKLVVGSVEAVLRMKHTPYNASFMSQHTVFAFKVEEVILGESLGPDPVIQVRQNQGNLRWADGQHRGVGMRLHDEPMLRVGCRYMLLLVDQKGPHQATVGVITGPAAEACEHIITGGGYGMFLIEDERLKPVPFDIQGYDVFGPWSFPSGDPKTLFGMTVQEAAEAIRKARADFLRKRGGGSP
jgi:hypothetical protein